MGMLLTKAELKKVYEKYPEGIPSRDIVKIFQSRGVKFSEATFRKYVQMGLVERCRRVGQKGKHRGSRGLYPASTVERINSIKRMISGDLTLEQLRGSYFSMRQKVEEAARILQDVETDLRVQEEAKGKKDRHDVQLARDLEGLGKNITKVVLTLEKLETSFLGE